MKRPETGEVEQRSAPDAPVTVEAKRLRGVIPYGVESRDLGGWREVMEPGCLSGASMADLVARVDHVGVPLGRFPGTLEVEDRDDGLHWAVSLPNARADVREAVERGDMRAGSWRMIVGRERWDGNVRRVLAVEELRDVSVVTNPAYDARAELRSAPDPPTNLPEGRADPQPKPPEAPVPETPPPGGLRIEDRAAHSKPKTAEDRILDAIASVPPGESRDLTHATAGPVEPDDLRTVLIDKFREASVVVASGVPVIPTDKLKVSWPVLTGDITPVFLDELEPIPESDPSLDDFEVPVKALKALVRMSSEAAEDSDPDLLRLVSTNITTAMVLKGDRELVAGSDPKGFQGFLNVPGTQTLAVGGALHWDHVIKAVGLLVEALVPGPYAVLMGPRPLTALDLMKELTSGSNAYVGRPASVPPIFSTGWLPVSGGAGPKTTVVVFSPSQSMVVLRKSVTVEIDRSEEFSRDAILARGRYRLGLGVPHPQSIVKLTGVDAPAIT